MVYSIYMRRQMYKREIDYDDCVLACLWGELELFILKTL